MIEIVDPQINELVNYILPKGLIDLEGLIVAGGFASFLYSLHIKTKEHKRIYIKNLLNCIRSDEYNNIGSKVSDVDFWILEGTTAHRLMDRLLYKDDETDNELKRIMQNLISSKESSLSLSDSILKNIFSNVRAALPVPTPMPSGLTLKDIVPMIDCNEITHYGLTGYAMSFNGSNRKDSCYIFNRIQIIRRKTYESIEDVLSGFDINTCQAAWKNNCLYVSEACESDFALMKLSANKKVADNLSEINRLKTVQRLIKYYKRHSFEPDQYTFDLILATMIDAASCHSAKLAEIKENEKSSAFKANPTSTYPISSGTDLYLYESILCDIKILFCFDRFDNKYIPYFIGSQHSIVESEIQKILSGDKQWKSLFQS